MEDQIIFWVVVLARFLLPLLIPIFPLPVMIACMILDGVDQTIFQKFTSLPLDNYQGYDKALDIYYLTIAYLATLRNWSNVYGYKVGRFLYYFRLIGDLIFELTHIRAVLLIFPNTFEYFFDFYEAIRMRWNPKRLSPKFLIIAAAFIWIFIKLPQEYWIHVAQLDMTDFLKANPTVLVLLIALVIASPFILMLVFKKLPGPDWKLQLKATPEIKPLQISGREHLFEKLVLVSFISVIFAQILPGIDTGNIQLAIGVIIVIAANTFIMEWIRKIRQTGLSIQLNFTAVTLINILLAVIYIKILGSQATDHTAILFFSLMLALIVTMYDYFRPYYQARIT